MSTVEEAQKRLEGIEGHVAVAIWQREDVLGKAEELGIKITPEQADELLDEMDRRQDASIGINWDTIEMMLLWPSPKEEVLKNQGREHELDELLVELRARNG